MNNKVNNFTSWTKLLSQLFGLAKEAWAFVTTVAGVAGVWAYLQQWGYVAIAVAVLAAFLLGLFIAKLFNAISHGNEATMSDGSKKSEAGNVSITSYNQSGGITAQHVHVNPKMQRVMGAGLKSGLLAKVPRNKRIVVWSSMGIEESYILANEIFSFLKNNGFTVFGESAFQQMFTTPLRGIRVYEEGENFNIEVGLPDGSEAIP